MVYLQNHDTKTCQVMGNHDSYGLASQASAEYGQEDNEPFRAAFTKWFTRKIVIQKWAIMTPMALHHKHQQNMVKKMMKHFVLLYKMVYSQNRDTQSCPVMGNHDSYSLASQE
jgi:D-lyxose ketol-isomerase